METHFSEDVCAWFCLYAYVGISKLMYKLKTLTFAIFEIVLYFFSIYAFVIVIVRE